MTKDTHSIVVQEIARHQSRLRAFLRCLLVEVDVGCHDVDALGRRSLRPRYASLHLPTLNYGAGANPVMAGSGKATITDYGNMLEMILNNGSYNGQQVLSSAAINEMLTPNTVGIPFLNNPPRFPGGQYGFGLWLDIFDDEGNPILLASPCSSGFSPFIDLENEFWAIVMYDGGQSHATETLAIYDHILSEIQAIPEPTSPAILLYGIVAAMMGRRRQTAIVQAKGMIR